MDFIINHKFIFLGVFLIFIVALGLTIVISSRQQKNSLVSITPTPGTAVHTTRPTLMPTQIIDDPELDRITLVQSRVSVRNFYQDAEIITADGDTQIAITDDYQISFIPQIEQFKIGITASPFEAKRRQAELAFLAELEITPEDACRLNVEVYTPLYANPDQAGQQFPLSFCE